ncbi:TPA: restriction endonuclease subunit S, partial [Pseudomonas aeruginosa]|nr:restriction endonuclease subunit S [Pseudomonas aeruginosa]
SNSNKYIETTKLKIKPEGLSKTRQVKPGDFLLTNSMSFGRPYIMKTTGCIHDGWLVLSGDPEKVDSDYFYHLLGSDLLKRRFSALAAGAVVKNLNIDLVKGVEIPLPPLPEQKRIAAILDKADAIRRKRQQAIQLADDFLRAVFLDMFGDPVTNPKGWDLLPFSAVGTLDRGKSRHRPRNDPAL